MALKQGYHPNAQAVVDHVAEHVAHYKRMRMLEFVAEIPKSAPGKVLRDSARCKNEG